MQSSACLCQQLSPTVRGRRYILYKAYTNMRQTKKGIFLFLQNVSSQNSIVSNNDQVHIIMTAVSYSSHHSVSSSSNRGRGEKTITFQSSKLCLLIALLLGWLLMDITFHAAPQAAVWNSAFWNEQLCDAPLKLVQHGTIHHLQHCQREAAASPCLPVTTGLQEEASITS